MRALTGKYLVVDVGYSQIKVLFVKVSRSDIQILGSGIIETTPEIMGSAGVKNYKSMAQYISKELESFQPQVKNIVFISSRIPCDVVQKEFIISSGNNVQELFDKSEDGRRFPTNTKIRDYQTFGTFISEDEIREVTLITTANVAMCTAIYKEFKECGYNVVSINNSTVVSNKLISLMSTTYDDSIKIIVDFGLKISVSVMLDGTPRFIDSGKIDISDFINTLSETFNIPVFSVCEVLETVGIVRTEESDEKLYEMGILNSEEYFEVVTAQFKDLMIWLDSKIDELLDILDVEADTIVGVGGFVDSPGIKELSKYIIKRMNLQDVISIESFQIKNVLDDDLEPVFMPCLGAVINEPFSHCSNLLPAENLTRTIDEVLIQSAKIVSSGVIVLSSVLFVTLVYNSMQLFEIKNIQNSTADLTHTINTLTSDIKRLDECIEASETASNYLEKLILFSDSYSNSIITIASIDSKSILTPAVVQESIEGEELVKPKEGMEESADEIESLSKTLDLADEDLIIRGYSTSTAAISQLLEDLQGFDFISKAVIGGINKQILPSLEPVYTFEITIVL